MSRKTGHAGARHEAAWLPLGTRRPTTLEKRGLTLPDFAAKANGLPVMAWLTFVLEELPHCTNDEQRRALLPHRFDIRRLNKNASDD